MRRKLPLVLVSSVQVPPAASARDGHGGLPTHMHAGLVGSIVQKTLERLESRRAARVAPERRVSALGCEATFLAGICGGAMPLVLLLNRHRIAGDVFANLVLKESVNSV
jgi:hypothetical protein